MKDRQLTFADIMCPMYTDPLYKPLHIIGAHIRGAIYWAKRIKEKGYDTACLNLMDKDIDSIFDGIDMLEALGMVEEGTKIRITHVTRKVCSKMMHELFEDDKELPIK